MPNPSITPAWGADLTYTVTNTDYLAIDVRLSELDVDPGQIELTVPAGATVRVVQNPALWTEIGSQILGGGAWVPGPTALGAWNVTVADGAAVTDPATIEITNPNGMVPDGRLRILCTGLAGGSCVVAPAGGNLSIDRLLASPSIINPLVSSGTPVYELDAVSLTATAQATVQVNPAPLAPLPVLPPIVGSWTPEPANPLAVTGFMSVGTSATFSAPGAYSTVNLGFRLKVGYDLNSSTALDPGEPFTEHVLTVPIETITHGVVLVLDRSGSMGSPLGGPDTKWQGTVKAAHACLDLFRSFRSGTSHKAGIVTFEHDGCSWTPVPAADNVTLRNPQNGAAINTMQMDSLPTFGDQAALSLGTDETCTPIGDALVKGLECLAASFPNAPDNRATMILLTDGYENSGEVTIKLMVGPASTTFAAKRITPGTLSYANDLVGNRLFTIAVGASVDEDRLNDLPNPPGSGMGPGYYRLTTNVKEILPTFADMLGQVLDSQRILPTVAVIDPGSPSNPVYFDVPTGEQRVAFLVPWSSATHNLEVAWRLQGSNGAFTIVTAPSASVLGYWRRQAHGLLTVDLATLTASPTAPATQFRVRHLDAGNVSQPLTDADVLAMVDLVTKAEIRFDKTRYFTGDPIKVSCSIRNGGLRVPGATVGVDLAAPGQGLGTFLTTGASLYKRVSDGLKPSGADPDQGKGLMFKTLLKQKELGALPVVTPPAFALFDDGAHGDGAANDGDYANTFGGTDKEGTYTFRFRIEGTIADGSRFSRLFVRSTWVGVKPDPVATTVAWTSITGLPAGQLGGLMTLVPKSAKGEFLGPFRADVIKVSISGGVADGPLIDNVDGSYSQRLLYRRGDDPIVGISVYDITLRPNGPTLGGGNEDCTGLLIRAIRCYLRKLWRRIFG